MTKHSNYMTRAMKSRDRRYARVLSKLGYGTRDMTAAEPEVVIVDDAEDEITSLRAEYAEVLGKKPFHGWDAETLREKIAAAREESF